MPIKHDPMNAWLAVLREPLAPQSVVTQIWADARAAVEQDLKQAAIFFSGLVADLVTTLPNPDPWRNLSARLPSGLTVRGEFDVPDEVGATGRHGTFGTWRDGSDLEPPTRNDPRLDAGLVALSTPLAPMSAVLIACAHTHMTQVAAELERDANLFDVGSDALRWAIWRRKVYMGPEDDLVDVCFLVWLGWSARIAAGERIDEADRVLMLSRGAVEDDKYFPVIE